MCDDGDEDDEAVAATTTMTMTTNSGVDGSKNSYDVKVVVRRDDGSDPASAAIGFFSKETGLDPETSGDTVHNIAKTLTEKLAALSEDDAWEAPGDTHLRTASKHINRAKERMKAGDSYGGAADLVRAILRPSLDSLGREKALRLLVRALHLVRSSQDAEKREEQRKRDKDAKAQVAEEQEKEEAREHEVAAAELKRLREEEEADWVRFEEEALRKAGEEGARELLAEQGLQLTRTNSGDQEVKSARVFKGDDAPHAAFQFCQVGIRLGIRR